MLLTKAVKIKWNSKNKKYYENKRYIYTKMGDEFTVKIEDLSNGSKILVDVKCDCEKCKKPYLNNIVWKNYLKCVHEDGKYYCQKCAHDLFGNKKANKTKLLKDKSFYECCLEHNRFDILLRWDFELNMCSPQDILFGTKKSKCSKNIHPSELKNIGHFTSGQEGSIQCSICNSIGQYICDTYGIDKLNYYWDWYKNINKNGEPLDPFTISRGSKTKVYIYCQKHSYHDSYPVSCHSFINRNRCPILLRKKDTFI
jgi:hypothetical protein